MADAEADNSGQRAARPNWRRLYGTPAAIWLVLLALLAASCGSAFIPLGSYNAALNLVIAAIMLFLLATFLMDLGNASALMRIVAGAGLFWAIFLFALTFTDYLSRRPTLFPPAAESSVLEAGKGVKPLF